ncbi:flavodoxin family protein [Rhodoferax sediminis]|jgi:multimeric flavodoxin WrbA|uniref:Flavoprotein WrbA n=1 Tax=Rhodoferax sediminis TaxID=2509614 RepID=A0A515D9T8_9BURK|nr:flavodoxin family protein [Rhodoferax sediminis]QDL37166.1 flavodoxin family protein [Rhodoferax sediminis]
MATVAVVYHSGYGHTQRMAQAVAEGAGASGAVSLVAIDADGNVPADGWDTLAAADAIIFGSPTYMGNVSWQFKKFADASSRVWYAQGWRDKIAGGFTNSAGMNGDKGATLTTLFNLGMQHAMIWVSQGLMPSNTKAATRNDVNYLVSYGGAIASSPADASPMEMAPGDLETARLFGQRVAGIAAKVHG